MSGAQLTTPAMLLSALNAAAAWKASCVNLNSHFRRLHAGVDQRVQHEEVRRRVLRQHHRLAAQVRHRLDRLADDDAVAAVRPVDLLVDARHDARVLAQPFEEERQHVERGPADVQVAGGVRVAHRDRIVDEHELDLEVLAVGRLPRLARLEAVVGEDDRAPAGPDVDREADGAVRHRLVARDPLDLGQLRRRDVVVFLDRRDAGGVGRLGARLHLRQLVGRELPGRRLRPDRAVAPQRQADEAEHHERGPRRRTRVWAVRSP